MAPLLGLGSDIWKHSDNYQEYLNHLLRLQQQSRQRALLMKPRLKKKDLGVEKPCFHSVSARNMLFDQQEVDSVRWGWHAEFLNYLNSQGSYDGNSCPRTDYIAAG